MQLKNIVEITLTNGRQIEPREFPGPMLYHSWQIPFGIAADEEPPNAHNLHLDKKKNKSKKEKFLRR